MRWLNRALLTPIFGLAMALAFAAALLVLDRPLTPRALEACLTIAFASAVSALVAVAASYVLRRRGWSVRFAAALLILLTGTGVLTAVIIGATTAWTSHPLLELSPKLVLIILALMSAGALYSFLTIAGFLLLPIGLPVTVLAAVLIARGS